LAQAIVRIEFPLTEWRSLWKKKFGWGGMKRLLVKFEAYQYQYNVDSKYPRNYEN
jgi:hypothetical protein